MINKELLKILEKEKRTPAKTFLKKFKGKQINWGGSRIVYEFKLDSRYVIKIQRNNSFNDNIREAWIWDEIIYSEKAKYFAPVLWISRNGKILIQRKIKTSQHGRNYPTKLPSMFNDFKFTNYGFLGKNFVCCDYAGCFLFKNVRLKKVKWWSETTLTYTSKK